MAWREPVWKVRNCHQYTFHVGRARLLRGGAKDFDACNSCIDNHRGSGSSSGNRQEAGGWVGTFARAALRGDIYSVSRSCGGRDRRFAEEPWQSRFRILKGKRKRRGVWLACPRGKTEKKIKRSPRLALIMARLSTKAFILWRVKGDSSRSSFCLVCTYVCFSSYVCDGIRGFCLAG